MRTIAAILLCSLAVAGCEYNNIDTCYHGKIIMTNCCAGTTYISLDSGPTIGTSRNLNGQEYSNVIEVPGYLTENAAYMNLRGYNPEKDAHLLPPVRCQCLVAEGMDVPTFVVTAASSSSCP